MPGECAMAFRSMVLDPRQLGALRTLFEAAMRRLGERGHGELIADGRERERLAYLVAGCCPPGEEPPTAEAIAQRFLDGLREKD